MKVIYYEIVDVGSLNEKREVLYRSRMLPLFNEERCIVRVLEIIKKKIMSKVQA